MIAGNIIFQWHAKTKDFITVGQYKLVDGKEIGYGASEIADWLWSDIQSLRGLDKWINWITLADQGLEPGYDVDFGNAQMVAIVKDKVFIHCEYVEGQSVLLTTQQLLPVLQAYRTYFLGLGEGRYRNEQDIPDPIPVEYIAESEEAINLYENLDGSYGMPE